MLTKKDQVKSNRLKKPYCGKNRNRKGNRKDTRESLNPNKPVRFLKAKLRDRVYRILNLNDGLCQVCNASSELDYPHHVEQGSKKDDRTMINICIYCHDLIHRVGYEAINKTREECKVIAWSNHE